LDRKEYLGRLSYKIKKPLTEVRGFKINYLISVN
jgi:hypothetical protein